MSEFNHKKGLDQPQKWTLGAEFLAPSEEVVVNIFGRGENDQGELIARNVKLKDARLIAVAPELLAELQNIANAKLSNFSDAEEFREWARSRAQFAIDKVSKFDETRKAE